VEPVRGDANWYSTVDNVGPGLDTALEELGIMIDAYDELHRRTGLALN
jgi:hypothetical protein